MVRYHVIRRKDGWALKREGAAKATKVYETKDKAKSEAETYRSRGSDIVIHKENGYVEKWMKGL